MVSKAAAGTGRPSKYTRPNIALTSEVSLQTS